MKVNNKEIPMYLPATIITIIGAIGMLSCFLLNADTMYYVAVIVLVMALIALGMYTKILPTGIFFKYDQHNKVHKYIRLGATIVLSLYIFITIWYMIAIFVNSVAIATPLETFQALYDLMMNGDPSPSTGHKSMWAYMGSSMITFLKGFLIAFVVAIPLGLLLGSNKTMNDIATPAIEVLRPIAPIAWAPIFILSMGANMGPMFVVAIGIFFPLLTNTIFGVMKIDKNLIDASKTLGANKWQIFGKVMIPCSLPYVMNGVKIGLGIGWMCIIAAELYNSSLSGIGGFLCTQSNIGNWPNVYACLIMIAAMGLITTGVAQYLHKFLTKRMGFE